MSDIDLADFGEVLRRFERWRIITKILGRQPYDEPNLENGRLYFRWDYANQVAEWPPARERGDWGAYVIETTSAGLFKVVRSLVHERTSNRSKNLEAIFWSAEDSGKYVIAQTADELYELRDESQYVKWEAAGLDPAITVSPPSDEVALEFSGSFPGASLDRLRKRVSMYAASGQHMAHGATSSDNQPYMQVLSRDFNQLDAELLDGLPLATVPALR